MVVHFQPQPHIRLRLTSQLYANTSVTGQSLSSLVVSFTVSPSLAPSPVVYCYHRADVTIVVSALGTGYSSAVHGVITTTQRAQLPRRQTLQYKALDSGVLCGLVGSSF